jgi:hypothetical protein
MVDYSKYIIVEHAMCQLPIVFDLIIDHETIGLGLKVISAGFVKVFIKDDKLEVSTFGESHTLQIKSRVEDTALLKKMLIK